MIGVSDLLGAHFEIQRNEYEDVRVVLVGDLDGCDFTYTVAEDHSTGEVARFDKPLLNVVAAWMDHKEKDH